MFFIFVCICLVTPNVALFLELARKKMCQSNTFYEHAQVNYTYELFFKARLIYLLLMKNVLKLIFMVKKFCLIRIVVQQQYWEFFLHANRVKTTILVYMLKISCMLMQKPSSVTCWVIQMMMMKIFPFITGGMNRCIEECKFFVI